GRHSRKADMVLTTNGCNKFGHKEFLVEADTSVVPEVYLRNIMGTIESMISEGSVLLPGQTFQIGWMLTQVQSHDSGLLTLAEPDLRNMPVKWVPGITQSLRHLPGWVTGRDGSRKRDE